MGQGLITNNGAGPDRFRKKKKQKKTWWIVPWAKTVWVAPIATHPCIGWKAPINVGSWRLLQMKYWNDQYFEKIMVLGRRRWKRRGKKFGARKNLNAFLCPLLLFGGPMKTTEAKIPSRKFVYFYDYLDLSEDTNLCVCVLGVRVRRLCVCDFGTDPILLRANRQPS